ncbi:ATP synthase protein I [Sphingomonas sp. EC-HK361]|uniref:AtpZ/AtpI family protein n=1 Tax=Sphingomonas sp. EC-HK361 TaxID=2038397 RepID=UPI0012523D76|nr:AtpZ/AtpI family protein [Sphingomonas sp. EC-HK361]VVT16994.1 ATP synthase protein I [Sphingomonas sp. EC-HK361]
MAEDKSGPDPHGDDARLTSLDARLRAAERQEADRTGSGKAVTDDGYRLGNRVLAELLGGMIGGALIGWVIDLVAGTKPWGLLVMLALGIVVAFRNIIRISNRRSK